MPSSGDVAEALSASLRDRLVAATPYLFEGAAHPIVEATALATLPTSLLLRRLAEKCARDEDRAKMWLLLVAMTGAFPLAEDVEELHGRLRAGGPAESFLAVLDAAVAPASMSRHLHRGLEIVANATIVDVHFSATNGLNTGVQRVVRQTMRRWQSHSDVHLVAWTRDGRSLRRLDASERERATAWTSRMRYEMPVPDDSRLERILVPWRSTVVVPEVPLSSHVPALRGVALYSGSPVVIVGHDAIPVLSPLDVLPDEAERFAHFLSVVKHAARVVCVSESAAGEFEGFRRAVRAQGLDGPDVMTVRLPSGRVDVHHEPESTLKRKRPGVPLLLNVGSQEPRKNQTALLAAAELLWREGKEFELLFIGSGSPPLSASFEEGVRILHKRGRPVSVLRHASDADLVEAYEVAACTVFVSLHEGFGLPVVESLAHATPVIASNFGAVAETSSLGGCLLVDPRDPAAIAAAIVRILDEPDLVERLREEIAALPERTWDDYAADLLDRVREVVP